MEFAMKLVYALLVLLTVAPVAAFAERLEATSEEIYLSMCQPKSEFVRSLDEGDLADVQRARGPFLAFLANPAPLVEQLKAGALLKKGAGLGEVLGALFLYSATCQTAEAIDRFVANTGCFDEAGKAYDSRAAVKLCWPVSEALRKMNQ